MKKIVVLGMATVLSCLFSVSAIAGTWESERINNLLWEYRYVKDDGDYAKNEWIQDADGAWYHFDQQGIMQTSQWTEDGYWLNDKGKMETNVVSKDGYYVGDDGRAVLNSDQLKTAYDNHIELRNSKGTVVELFYHNNYEGENGLAFHVDSIVMDQGDNLLANLTRVANAGKKTAKLIIPVMGQVYNDYGEYSTQYHSKTTHTVPWYQIIGTNGWYECNPGNVMIFRKSTQARFPYLSSDRAKHYILYLGKPRMQ